MNHTYLFNNIFCIPHEGKYILYQPFLGLAFLTNPVFVNLLYKARLGDKDALTKLNLEQSLIDKLFETELKLEHSCNSAHAKFQPDSVSLFLTNNCTLRCRYCYAEGGNDSREMPWDMVAHILDEVLQNALAKKSDRMVVNFHGGGDISAAWPLLEKTKAYLDKLSRENHISIITSVGSNGILTPAQREWLIQNIGSATVSIDGTEEIQNTQRPFPGGAPSFPIVDETLKRLDEAGYPYAIRSTITAESVLHLEEIINFFCERYQARKIKFEPMYPRGRAEALHLKAPDAKIFVEEFRKARKIASQAGRELIYSGARLEALTHTFCQAAGNSCAVTPEGWITSCYEVLSLTDPLADTFFYGKYNPQSKKLEIDEERRKRLFQLAVTNNEFCEKCFCKWHCAGDCSVKSLHAERSEESSLPDRCYINRELTKDQLIEAIES